MEDTRKHLPDSLLDVYAEQMGITRIFVNLIENAIQYGKENGSIKIVLKKRNQGIQVKVIDDGFCPPYSVGYLNCLSLVEL